MIKIERPPNFDAIVAVFPHAKDPGILFAYGEDIYNPSDVAIPRALMEHEYRHCANQFTYEGGAEAWWARYLVDQEFRYQEELVAHVSEYVSLATSTNDRNLRAKLSMRTSQRLVAPLYNYNPPRSARIAQWDIERLAHRG